MSSVSLESRWTAVLVPSPTKLPTSRPALSTRTSLASGMESSGVGARAGRGPVSARMPHASTPATSRVEATMQRDMAPNVTGAERVGKGAVRMLYLYTLPRT